MLCVILSALHRDAPRMGRAAMRNALALVGALILSTAGEALADPGASIFETSTTIRLTTASLLPHSSTDDQLSKESARSSDPEARGGFRTEFEAIEANLDIPGAGLTPVGNLKVTRLMLSGLYEFSSGAWRLKPYIGAGVGVIDVSARLLGHEESSITPDFQFKSGVKMAITQKIFGSFEWRWSHGSKPTFALGGVPTKFQLKRGGFMLGVNYKLQ
jgi:opacity protein-like surface antigen